MLTATDFIRYPQVLPQMDQIVTDEKLRQHITAQIHEACDMLMQLDELKLCDIQVAVMQGEVVLSGKVECSRLLRLAESIARFTLDVVSVTNQIQVGEEASPPTISSASPLAHLMDVAVVV
jgi:osmotically-inducible protein OsmY